MVTNKTFPAVANDFLTGKCILIDKPAGWTSFDVVNKLRYALRSKLQIKKIKVGHAGTLDPLAEGLMIVCSGKATKTIAEFLALPKTYETTLFFGATTPSFDREMPVDTTYPTEHITKELLESTIDAQFKGSIAQIPPQFSAKRIDGKRAYQYARKGETKTLKPKLITIDKFEITRFQLPEVTVRITGSSGTYIRSIARDLGKAVGSGAYLKDLQRTHIGTFTINDALNIETFLEKLGNCSLLPIKQ
jgi:tRNA pseudouridine55 synthase